MQKTSFAGLKRLVAIAVVVLTMATFMPSTLAFTVGPQILNAYTTPSNGAFDPKQGALNFYYDIINGPANVKVEVYDCNVNCQVPIHTIFNSTLQQSSTGNHYTWAGKANGQFVAAKSYTIRISLQYNTFTDSKDLQATVINTTPIPPLPPIIIDKTAPVLNLTGPVANPSYTQTPSFTFSSTEAGTINYYGGCTANMSSASAGSNTVTLNTLSFGTYNSCYITVRDAASNVSAPLYLNSFTVQQSNPNPNPNPNPQPGDTTAPTVTISSQIPSPTTNHYPSFALTTSEYGTLTVGGGCSTNNTTVATGTNTVTLNYLPNGTYSNCYVQVRDAAGNTSSTVYLSTFVINDQGQTPGNQAPVVSNVYTSPNPFNPNNQSATVYYTINTPAYVTVQVMQGNEVSRTLADYVYQTNNGNNSYNWDGRDRYGSMLSNGTYTIKVTAQNSYGTNYNTGSATIWSGSNGGSGNNSGTLVSNLRVTNATFNPRNGQNATLCFSVLNDYTNIAVDVIPYTNYHTSNNYYSNNAVRTLVDNNSISTNYNYCLNWDGRDRYGNYVGDDVFQFRVKASRNGVYDTQYAYTEVDTDGVLYGFPGSTGGNNGGNCGGFIDVPANNPYCKAIEYLQLKGIFTGYPDGTFKPYQAINRAETTKVILLALGISNITDANYNYYTTNYYNNYNYNYTNSNYYNPNYIYNNGYYNGRYGNSLFWDTNANSWYMPYLRTAHVLGIISGYPDGSFRPSQTVIRVELLKIFLEATGISIPTCNVGPFADTPLTTDTRWYMNYVCFAANNDLMDANAGGNFKPAEPMTRGDVANLFYQFYVRGMYNRVNLTRYNSILYPNNTYINTKYTNTQPVPVYTNPINNGVYYTKYYY